MSNEPSKPNNRRDVVDEIVDYILAWRPFPMKKTICVKDLVQDIPRSRYVEFEALRMQAFEMAQKVYDDRVASYNIDRPCYEEQIYGPISLVSEIYKRARRLASLTSPIREEPLREVDINRMLDICIDTVNYLTWTYALISMVTGHAGHMNSDDSPDYRMQNGLVGLHVNLKLEEDDGTP